MDTVCCDEVFVNNRSLRSVFAINRALHGMFRICRAV
jgi:hypothetical protein